MARKDISDLQVIQACSDRGSDSSINVLIAKTGQCFKVCLRAMERAYARGYIGCGVSIAYAWPTERGKAILHTAIIPDMVNEAIKKRSRFSSLPGGRFIISGIVDDFNNTHFARWLNDNNDSNQKPTRYFIDAMYNPPGFFKIAEPPYKNGDVIRVDEETGDVVIYKTATPGPTEAGGNLLPAMFKNPDHPCDEFPVLAKIIIK
jgi:hypothetical protein